jgi:Regulator of ribonuclease activity B
MSHFALKDLEDMFANMRAQTRWDIDGELLWGYFFTDPNTRKLEQLSEHLTAHGYRLVLIYPTDDRSTHILHVERVEKHTPQTLFTRNGEFERLAGEFNLQSYDGMDVGPASMR